METERGGWTLVATKVSPGFPFIKTVFSSVATATKNKDAASHIHPSMVNWTEVMFRFADVDTIRVIYNRKAGAPNKDKEEFDKFLMGKSMKLIKNVNGFYKYSPEQITKQILAWVLPPYPLSPSGQTLGSQNITVARINGLTCGMVLTAPETTTSTVMTAGRGAPNVSRATVI